MSHLMDYGDDWPPRPRKPFVFDRVFWVRAALPVVTLVLVAAMAVISDRPQRVDFPITGSTTSPHPHHA